MTHILAWLLINTWVSLLIMKAYHETPTFWEDFAWLALMSVTTIFPFLIIRWMNTIKRKNKQKRG